MSTPDYGEAFADVYDEWYADVSDVDATVERVAALAAEVDAGRVLELGVGSGRIALALAAEGVHVEGVDSSEAMLDLLTAKQGARRVVVHRGDMTEVDTFVEGPFAVVLVAFNTFFNLDDESRQRRCLQGVAALLAEHGSLLLETFVPGPALDQAGRDLSTVRVEVDRVVLAATEHDPDTQTITGQHIDITGAGTRLRPWRIRYATPEQLDEMAGAVGLRLAERTAGWHGEPFDPSGTTQVARYVKETRR